MAAVRDAESSPGGSSSNALDVTTAERARAPPQPLLMVAKCSVMIGGHQVSSRRLLGRPVPKSDSAGSRRCPQHTRKSRAARAMTPVLQDKPHHSTDLAELVPTNILHYYLLFYCALCGKRPRTCRISLGGPSEGVPCDALLTPAVFGVSSSSGFRRRNLEIWGLSAANSRPIDQIDLYPP